MEEYSAEIDRIVREDVDDFSPGPWEVRPELLLGEATHAKDVPLLLRLGVTHVLNVAGRDVQTGRDFYPVEISYMAVEAPDRKDYDLIGTHLTDCTEFVRGAAMGGGKVLVHCTLGVNRSATIIVAYLIQTDDTHSLLDHIRSIKTVRGCLLTNTGFRTQLLQLAQQYNRLGPLPTLNYLPSPDT